MNGACTPRLSSAKPARRVCATNTLCKTHDVLHEERQYRACNESRRSHVCGRLTCVKWVLVANLICGRWIQGFDPLGIGNWDVLNMNFLREAEIKHGRVAMLGFAGIMVCASVYVLCRISMCACSRCHAGLRRHHSMCAYQPIT